MIMSAVLEAWCSLCELEQLQPQKKPHETRSSDARCTPEQSLGNCVTESAAVHLTSSSSLIVHCKETLGHLHPMVSASYRDLMVTESSLHLNRSCLSF